MNRFIPITCQCILLACIIFLKYQLDTYQKYFVESQAQLAKARAEGYQDGDLDGFTRGYNASEFRSRPCVESHPQDKPNAHTIKVYGAHFEDPPMTVCPGDPGCQGDVAFQPCVHLCDGRSYYPAQKDRPNIGCPSLAACSPVVH